MVEAEEGRRSLCQEGRQRQGQGGAVLSHMCWSPGAWPGQPGGNICGHLRWGRSRRLGLSGRAALRYLPGTGVAGTLPLPQECEEVGTSWWYEIRWHPRHL